MREMSQLFTSYSCNDIETLGLISFDLMSAFDRCNQIGNIM